MTIINWLIPLAHAEDGVTFVVPINGSTGITPTVPGGLLFSYIGVIFKFMAGITGLVLLVFIVFYGFEVMFSGIADRTADAKKGLTASVGGFILLLTSGLLLYTLNPSFFRGFGTESGGKILGEGTPGSAGPITPPAENPPTDATPADALKDTVTKCGAPNRTDVSASAAQKNAAQYSGAIAAGGPSGLVTPQLVGAIIQIESNDNANIGKNSVGAIGLMQIQLPTAQQYCGSGITEADLQDGQKNATCGTKVLKAYVAKYGLRNGIAAYNGGGGAAQNSVTCSNNTPVCGSSVRRWECKWDSKYDRENQGYKETRNYVANVLRADGICPGSPDQACQ